MIFGYYQPRSGFRKKILQSSKNYKKFSGLSKGTPSKKVPGSPKFKLARGQGELRFSRSAFWYENGGLFCFYASVAFRRIRIERRYVKHF